MCNDSDMFETILFGHCLGSNLYRVYNLRIYMGRNKNTLYTVPFSNLSRKTAMKVSISPYYTTVHVVSSSIMHA